jgi:hypothetical protein
MESSLTGINKERGVSINLPADNLNEKEKDMGKYGCRRINTHAI